MQGVQTHSTCRNASKTAERVTHRELAILFWMARKVDGQIQRKRDGGFLRLTYCKQGKLIFKYFGFLVVLESVWQNLTAAYRSESRHLSL